MLIKNFGDVETLYNKIRRGDILIICNVHRFITKYYWFTNGIFMISFNDGDYADYCYEAEFRRDLLMALKSEHFTVSLRTDTELEPIFQVTNFN